MPLALHLCERTEPPGVSTAEEWGGEEASAHLHSAREGSKMPSSMGTLAAIVAGASSDLDGSLPSVHLSRAPTSPEVGVGDLRAKHGRRRPEKRKASVS